MNKLHKPFTRIQQVVLETALREHPVVVLHGARQTGKTTLCGMIESASSRRYYTLDEYDILDQSRRSPESLVEGGGPITLDEVQRSPQLLHQIKAEVDKDRTPGRFLLTGSADLLLMKEISESLAGRAVYVHLTPLTTGEIEGRIPEAITALVGSSNPDDILDAATGRNTLDSGDLIASFLEGGFPPAVLAKSAAQRRRWFDGYIKTYLERDLRDLSNIANLPDFRRLMKLTAVRNMSLLNVSSLARDCGLTVPTARRHLNLLEVSHLVVKLPAFSANRGKRLVRSPKLYWADTGLAAHLAGLRSIDDFDDDGIRGSWLESYVVSQLKSHADMDPTGIELWHWRTSHGIEVDLVIDRGTSLIPVEVKSTTRPTGDHIRGVEAFLDLHPEAPFGVVICRIAEARRVSHRVVALPVAALTGRESDSRS